MTLIKHTKQLSNELKRLNSKPTEDVSTHIQLGLFHLKVGGGGTEGIFEGREGPNSELIYPIRLRMISDFLSSVPPPTTLFY